MNSQTKEVPSLAYDQNYLQFNFTDTTPGAQQSFAYQLKGLDYAWLTCNNCSQITYAHLDGGEYTFEVRANRPGAPVTAFNFIIEGNIWHKWWFVPSLFVYFLSFFGIAIYFVTLVRFRQKQRQQRLVYKEKMASMSQLTSGIAHEIQNPLNFVNNFSELNTELLDELQQELKSGNFETAAEITGDISQNQLKINSHGKRADSIVKMMLQHSRSNTGKPELTDINALIEEQVKLSYHNFLGIDKSFQAVIRTDFDPGIKRLKLIPQDIGKVLMNLLSNAFYAVNEKRKSRLATPGNAEQGEAQKEYEPMVTISTSKINGKAAIVIADNGNGIPQKVPDKTFQPFSTTRPTGQGTGLGLSLSYDIVKAHGGALMVETKEGEGSEFIIQLPFT